MSADAMVDVAMRTRAATLSVCTTGSTTLSATATGYARAAGSFLTDGFQVGMEVTPNGFTATAPGTIIFVSALVMTIRGGRTAEAAASGRTLSVGLPSYQVYDNKAFTQVTGRQYIEMGVIPQPSTLISAPANVGTREDRGLYVFRWFGLADTGAIGLRSCIDALAALFTPGTTLTLSDGTVARIRGDFGSYASQVIPQPPEFAMILLTVQWRRYATNIIAP